MMADGKTYEAARRKVRIYYILHPLRSSCLIKPLRVTAFSVLTGLFGYTSTRKSPHLDRLRRGIGARTTAIQACYILNELTMRDIDPTGSSGKMIVLNKVCVVTASRALCRRPSPTSTVRIEYAATAMSVLRGFRLESLAREFFEADGVHNSRNMFSLELDSCADFNGLDLWFKDTDEVRRLWTYR